MSMRLRYSGYLCCVVPALVHGAIGRADSVEHASYPPLRELPVAAQRPAATGSAKYVDPVRGADSQAGTQERPWKSLGHAIAQVRPGDTLYLRGGIYWERIVASPQGTAE